MRVDDVGTLTTFLFEFMQRLKAIASPLKHALLTSIRLKANDP